MPTTKSILALLPLAGLLGLLPACTDGASDAHAFTPRHGGHAVELAAHGPILEVVHDAAEGVVKIYVFGPHQEVLELTEAPTCTIGDAAPITGEGAGTAWAFADERLKGHPHDVMLAVEIDGKAYSAGWHPPH